MGQRANRAAPEFGDRRAIEQLVVPVARGLSNDRVVPLVALLAETWELPVTLLLVSTSEPTADDELEAVRHSLRSQFPRVQIRTCHVVDDDPGSAIANAAGPGALLVMSSDQRSDSPENELVAEVVLGHVRVPLILVGAQVARRDLCRRRLRGEVVVALDDPATAENQVRMAVALAAALGNRPLWLVHVLPENVSGNDDRCHLARHLRCLAEQLSQKVPTRWQIISSDDPITALDSFAERRDASFLVASSASTRLSEEAGRPVLVVS